MKIRNSHVSNSSSSSFVLQFDRDYNNFEEFKEDLLKKGYWSNEYDKLKVFLLQQLYNDIVKKHDKIKKGESYTITYEDDTYFGSHMEYHFLENWNFEKEFIVEKISNH